MVFQSNNLDSKLYKSPFSPTFGTHGLNVPKIFYSRKAIEKENSKNHIPIDRMYEKIELSVSELGDSPNCIAREDASTSGTSQDQSQELVTTPQAIHPLKRKLKTTYTSRKRRKSTRQSRKDNSRCRTRKDIGFVRTPTAFQELIESFLINGDNFKLGQLKVSSDRFESIKEVKQIDDRGAINGCKVCDIGIGGDAKHMFKNSNRESKRNMTHLTASNKSESPAKVLKDSNHFILSLYEGKDESQHIMKAMQQLVPVMAKHEQEGILVNGHIGNDT